MCEFHYCKNCEYCIPKDNDEGEEILVCDLDNCEVYDESSCDWWKECDCVEWEAD